MHLWEIKKVLMVEHASVHRQLNSLFTSELIHKIWPGKPQTSEVCGWQDEIHKTRRTTEITCSCREHLLCPCCGWGSPTQEQQLSLHQSSEAVQPLTPIETKHISSSGLGDLWKANYEHHDISGHQTWQKLVTNIVLQIKKISCTPYNKKQDLTLVLETWNSDTTLNLKRTHNTKGFHEKEWCQEVVQDVHQFNSKATVWMESWNRESER